MELIIAVFVGGVLKGQKKVPTPCLIGRSKDATMVVAHPAMSRKHCELVEESGRLFLRDNGSLNGTVYRGNPIEAPVAVEIGDEFMVGELTFRIGVPAAPRTQEQLELAEKPTASIMTTAEMEGADPAMATILEAPSELAPTPETEPDSDRPAAQAASPEVPEAQSETSPAPADKPEDASLPEGAGTKPKKSSRKISPLDVRIEIK